MKQNKRFRIIGLSIGIFLLGFFVFTGASYALDNLDEQIDDLSGDLEGINDKMEEQESIIDELGEKIDQYEDNIKQKHNEKISLNNQVNVLEADIEMNEAEIEKKAAEIELLKLEIQELKLEIDETNQEISEDKDLLAKFIQELYRHEQKTYLEITFGHNSLSEYSAQAEYVKNLRSEFQDTLDDFQDLKTKLVSNKKEQTNKKELLKDEKENLEVKEASLNTEVDYKNDLLASVKQDEGKFQTLVAEVRQEVNSANSNIATLDQQYREKLKALEKKKAEKEQEEKAKDGDTTEEEEGTVEEEETTGDILPDAFNPGWPASGPITAYFHDPSYPFKQWFEHSGIDIGIGQGTSIAAADSGYVAIAKFDGSSNYSYIMIVHAEGYATVYGHMSGVLVGPDQYVEKGETIGYSGGVPGTPGAGRFSTGAHLHFEVRLNGIPVDPLPYLP